MNTTYGPYPSLGDDFIIKPFCQVITASQVDPTGFDFSFVDSTGSLLECNWFQVINIRGNVHGGISNNSYLAVEVSSFGTEAADSGDLIFDPATPRSVPGMITSQKRAVTSNSVEMLLPDSTKTTGITIYSVALSEIAVMYGVAIPYNPLRFKDRPTGV
jgi:hypothetical protein